jgi:hypothetical protein
VSLAAAVLVDGQGRTLLVRGEGNALFSRLWQFPATEVMRSPRARLARLLNRNYGIKRAPLAAAGAARHAVTFHNIALLPFLARVDRLPKVAGSRAVPLAQVNQLAVSSATRKIAAAALASLKPGES